jgi:hypothetical protein
MKWEYRQQPYFYTKVWILSLIPFAIAFFTDSFKWILAYGFFASTLGLLIISEQLEKVIYQKIVISEQIDKIIDKKSE